MYRPVRLLGLALFGRTGEQQGNLKNLKALEVCARNKKFLISFCDALKGPGSRSVTPPSSVHRLRPGDVDIIGALGDSLTAGNGIYASNANQLTVENRGVSFAIGGHGNWKQYLTLPNILKEFNPRLYGYALTDGLASDRTSRFNVAEPAAMSRDMPYMARVLVKRLQRDPHVNMERDWKMVTLLIGNNDFCLDLCLNDRPAETVARHELNMLQTYRYLRDNVPRLILNVIQPPDLTFLMRMKRLPRICSRILLPFECPCLYGLAAKRRLPKLSPIIKQWQAKDKEIVNRAEFNTETFTINYHNFTTFDEFIELANGRTDLRFLSYDCFHLSQRGHAMVSNALWNNLFEPPYNKSSMDPQLMRVFRCPTTQQPYILTRINSAANFKL
ncbi:phospholipase B1, membrane-associated-like [Scaptodrosophila lebanonensis]|uniref:Phospholipase B1, membrane-associated-like n=1 Tax=Drosophila lebanonensis TaxID=7225 RepID=A0A6J2TAK6_DROLE|nr:phospholipase B1, membrane-associated-like [Scaptodrosophila lebanonensis]